MTVRPGIEAATGPITSPPHPFLFTVIIVPFGAVSGYVSVAMAFLATKSGLTVGQAAQLIAAGMLPHVWKFFWAPVADTTLSRKRWYPDLSDALARSECFLASAAIPLSPENLRLLEGVNLLTNIAATFLGMSAEGLMAHATPPDSRDCASAAGSRRGISAAAGSAAARGCGWRRVCPVRPRRRGGSPGPL